MRDARAILEEIGIVDRAIEDITLGVATKFRSDPIVVASDVLWVLDELAREDLVVVTNASRKDNNAYCLDSKLGDDNSGVTFDDDSPVGDFCRWHDIPADLHVDLTDACTERCVHCYVPQNQHDFLPYELVEKVLHEFRAMNGLTVHLTGGEAMLHPDFERICRLCVELNLNFLVFSNMTVCDAKRIGFLKEVDPQFINVSLYSMKPEEHDTITRLSGSWRKTVDTILACEAAGVHCRLATPLLKENQDALPALKEFADAHRMHLVPSADIVAQADHGCSNLGHACSTEELRRVLSRDCRLFDKDYDGSMPSVDAKVCDIGEARLYLNAKGDYYPCDCMHGYVLGNVRENSLAEIWTGEKLRYLRGLKNRDFGSCAVCENRPWCKVCPAANFNATGDLFQHHPCTCALAGVVREVYGGN